jgi:hypothetical protein
VDPEIFGRSAHAAINALQEGDPIITVFEAFASRGVVRIFPDALRSGEARLVVDRLSEIQRSR